MDSMNGLPVSARKQKSSSARSLAVCLHYSGVPFFCIVRSLKRIVCAEEAESHNCFSITWSAL